MKKEILKLTGLTEDQFYKMYPTEAAFKAAYPNFKLGGTPEAFPQIATADNFFSYGVPVPPTYYMHGGPTVYPQIQTEAQFFSPVYSNTNNAYAVGGSYMEVHPEAKKYPKGPVGGSAFYMMQDGGSSMQEPTKDQTFYTQKMNDFFDKLRQASYKNLMNGIMNTEDQSTEGMKQLSMGRHGGLVSYQGNTTPSQTTQTNTGTAATTTQPAATTTTTQQPNFQMVTGADGQSYLVGPNNQLYAPYKGNQTTTTSTQQQATNYYPYMNNRGVYVGTGLDSVANWLIPNNPRERYRKITEQQGKGIGNLTEEQIKAIQEGTANVAEISYDTRRALFPRNRLKSVNIKFKTPAPGQAATTTQQDPNATTTTTPGTTATSTASSAATPGTTANPATTTTTSPATTTTTSPAASTTNQTATSTQPTTSTTPAASATATAPASAASSSSKSTTDDVNAKVAQMQKEAREKEFAETTELEMPAEERMKMQEEQNAIDAQFKNYENYKQYRDMMIRQGKTPEEFDFNRNYDYSSVNAPTTRRKSQAPSNANSMDAETAKKKASMIKPNVNQAYIDAQRAASQSSGPVIPSWQDTEIPDELEMPANERMRMEDERRAIEEQFRQYQEALNFDNPANYPSYKLSPYRLGGPYVLPMYQGNQGTGQVDPSQLYGPTTDEFNFNTPSGQEQEFEVGFNFGRTKKQGVNPYLPAMIRGAADFISGNQEDENADAYINRMMLAENVFKTEGQNRGDYVMNTPAGANFRPDQMVPVGYTGAGYRGFSPGISYSQYGGPMMFDVADLFFLTPQMLKNTRRG